VWIFAPGLKATARAITAGCRKRNLSALFAEDPERFNAITAVVLWTNMASTVRLLSACVQ
jgi:hypothetical protein